MSRASSQPHEMVGQDLKSNLGVEEERGFTNTLPKIPHGILAISTS
jgi:hypothetical protein